MTEKIYSRSSATNSSYSQPFLDKFTHANGATHPNERAFPSLGGGEWKQLRAAPP